MQRERGIERVLVEKIESLLNRENTSLRENTDTNSLQMSLFEVQKLVKHLYPNDENLKEILDRQDLFIRKGGIGDTTGITKTEMIMDFAKEIAESIGLEFLYNEDHIKNKGLEFSNLENHKETPSVTPSSNSSDSLQPREIAEKMEKIGVQKVNLNSFSAFILAITAGAFIALGGIYFTFATSQIIVTRPFTQIIGGMVFSMGLILVVIAGAELFTGNHLAIMGLASRKITVSKLLRNWILVYVGNFLGSVATAAILYMSKAWTNNGYQFGIRAMMIASHKVSLGFVEAFFLGILCNSLVCLALWLAASGKKVSDKVLAIIFPISAFVAIGFEHSVANMYFLTFSLMIKDDPMLLSAMKTAGITVDTSNIDYIGVLNNLVPVTLGNIVGGCIFVGLVYWLAYLRNNRKEN